MDKKLPNNVPKTANSWREEGGAPGASFKNSHKIKELYIRLFEKQEMACEMRMKIPIEYIHRIISIEKWYVPMTIICI